MPNEPRSVLVLAQSAGVGGVESSLLGFVRHIVARGHRVTVVFWRGVGPVATALPPEVTIRDVQTGIAGRLYRTGGVHDVLRTAGLATRAAGIAAIALRTLIRRYRNPWILLNTIPEHFDVAIAYRHNGYAPYYLIDRVSASKKLMWYHHGSYEPSHMGYAVDRAYYERMDSIVVVSEATRTMLTEHFPALKNHLRVIPNLLDVDAIRRNAQSRVEDLDLSHAVTLVTVSRLSAEKGVDLAVRTARVLLDRGLDFIWYVVGDGPERASLEGQVAELAVEPVFVLLGERTNPYPYVRLADVYVQTSRIEAHPLTINEAMVLGKPIVATDIPAIAEALKQGDLGRLAPQTPEAIADSILDLVQDPGAMSTLRERLALTRDVNSTAIREIDRLMES